MSLFQAGERDGAKGKSVCQQKVCHLLSHWPALCHVAIREAEKYVSLAEQI